MTVIDMSKYLKLEEKLECYNERLDYIATLEGIRRSGSHSFYFIRDDRDIAEDQLEFVSYDFFNFEQDLNKLEESVKPDAIMQVFERLSLVISELDEFIQAYEDASKDDKITTFAKLQKEQEEKEE